MHTLFTTIQNSLPAFFRSLPADALRDCCSPSDYSLGKDYFEAKAVSQLIFNNEKTRLNAIVNGNDNYSVTIMLDKGKITGSCTCAYYDVCKHIVATMLYAYDEKSVFGIVPVDVKDTGNLFVWYLHSLSKDELVALVDKFASKQFRTEVKNRFANADKAQKTFHEVEQTIRKFFDDDELMYSPHNFSDALDDELEKLSGFEKSLGKEIEEMLFYIIKRVDECFEDGYLYDDYGDENYDTSLRFDEFVVRYVASLSCSEKTAFLAKLDAMLGHQAYSAFESLTGVAKSVFTGADLPCLKNVLMAGYRNISRKLAGHYYDHVSGLMSYDEKTDILSVLMERNEVRAIELAALHDANGNLIKATETMCAWIEKNRDSYYCSEDAWLFYLDLLKKGNYDLSDIAADAIINSSTARMLSKIISLTEIDPARYEQLLEDRNAGELLSHLQKKGRLSEALALVKRKKNKIADNQILEFFKTHKLLFPEDAATCFGEVIDKNLQNTGNRYYESIVDAILHLEKVNPAKGDEYISYIRTNYKRRRNLIDLINCSESRLNQPRFLPQ